MHFHAQKITLSKRNRDTDLAKVPKWLDDLGIRIVSVGVPHLQRLAELPMFDDHRDPNDRLIVAQAISDRVPLISSDRKFERYRNYGLDFMFNER